MELKNTITKAKSSVDDLNSITEGREERISGRTNRTMKITQSEWQRENREKTIKRASGSHGTITKALIFVLLEFWKEKAQG